MNKKLGYIFILGAAINIALLVREFIVIQSRNSAATEYLKLGPYVLIVLCLVVAIAYAFGKIPSKNGGS